MKKILVLNFSILAILITVGCRQNIKELQDLKNKFTVGLNKINEHQIIPDSTNSNSLTNSNPTNIVNANTLLDNSKDEGTKKIELKNEFKMKTGDHSYIGQFLLKSNDELSKSLVKGSLLIISDLIQDMYDHQNDILLEELTDYIIVYSRDHAGILKNSEDVSSLGDFFSKLQYEHRTKLIEILLWENICSPMLKSAQEFRNNLIRSKNLNSKPSDKNDDFNLDEFLIAEDFYVNGRFIMDCVYDVYGVVIEKLKNKDDILECADLIIEEYKRAYKFLENILLTENTGL